MKNRKTKILCVVLLCISVFFIICFVNGTFTKNNENSSNVNYDIEGDAYIIKTKYANLQYPSKWKSRVSIVQNDTGKVIEFYADENIHLFDICFDSDKGYSLGKIVKDNATFNVSIESFSINQELYNETQYVDYCNMQEDSNYIVKMLVENYGLNMKLS